MNAPTKGKVVRLNQNTAHMLATLRSIIEGTYLSAGLREHTQLTDGSTIRLALEVAVNAISRQEPAARMVLGEAGPRLQGEWLPLDGDGDSAPD